MAEDKDDKTEEASEERLRKAKREGDSWSSREPGYAMALLGLFSAIALILPFFLMPALEGLGALFAQAGQWQIEDRQDLGEILGATLSGYIWLFLAVLAAMVVAAFLSALLSGPFFVSSKRIEPKFSKLNPMGGIKRLVSVNNLVEFAKSLVKLVLIAGLMAWVLYNVLDKILPAAILPPEVQIAEISAAARQGLIYLLALLIPVVVFDIFWKRRQWLIKQRMSRKEQKDEHKESQGDPMIRARRQEIGRRRIRQQIKQAVPQSTLVVMNPTHFAVALRYERGIDQAPVCMAKGADLLALRIRDLALEHDITVIESPPLARALYKSVEVEQQIPEEHWAAVAELVGYVLDMRRRIRRKLPEGAVQILN